MIGEDLSVMSLYNSNNVDKINSFKKNVKSTYQVDTNYEKVEVDFSWLDIMEDTIRYLDNILRNPNRFIVNEEEIVKVEQARRITVESIKHLSKHTNYIQEIEDNGDVKPSKILNINKDESYNTYENRVIYTLINNMRTFVEMRKRNLITSSYTKNHKRGQYSGVVRVGKENVSISISMDSKADTKTDCISKDNMTVEQRIEKLEMRITDLTNTPVYKSLAKDHVAKVIPPVKKTNLILKNTNFQYAMKLWNFLSEYRESNNNNVKDKSTFRNDEKTLKMYDDVFLLNYLVLNTLGTTEKSKDDPEVDKEAIEKLTNDMITKIVEINADMPLEDVKKMIGEKIAIIRNKKEVSLEEIQEKFNNQIQSYVEKIINFEF